jgi:ABC-type branched-subunit amino acid transport system permease subunit
MATEVTKKPGAGSGDSGSSTGASGHGGGPIAKLEVPPRYTGLHGLLGVHPVLLLIVAIGLVYPMIANEYWTFNLTVGLVLAIACLGLLVVVGWGREISLAQAGLVGSSVYITGYMARGDKPGEDGPGFPFPVAAAIGIAFVVAVSTIVALISMRLSGVYVVVLTLSLQFLLENSLFTKEKLTGGLSAPSTPRPNFFGLSMQSTTRMYYYILAVLLVSMSLLYRYRRSRFGRSLIMVGVDKVSAAAVGVSPWMYKVAAFAIAGTMAGIAGALSAPLYGNPPGINQYFSFNSLFYVSVPILAGFESIMATVGVAIFFQLLPQILLSLKINPQLLGGIGLTIGVLAGPRGLGGLLIDLFDSRARAKRRAAKANIAKSRARAGGGGGGGGSSGGRPAAPAKPKDSQLGAKAPASAGSEKK